MNIETLNYDDRILYKAGIPKEYWSKIKKIAEENSGTGTFGYYDIIRGLCCLLNMEAFEKLKEILQPPEPPLTSLYKDRVRIR